MANSLAQNVAVIIANTMASIQEDIPTPGTVLQATRALPAYAAFLQYFQQDPVGLELVRGRKYNGHKMTATMAAVLKMDIEEAGWEFEEIMCPETKHYIGGEKVIGYKVRF